MSEAEPLVEVHRGGMVESRHRGHAVVWHETGGLVASWGDPDAIILPRSSCKMVQALPLVESGVAARRGLTPRHLALACASHNGAQIHTELVTEWLSDLGLAEADLRCGPQLPDDRPARIGLIRAEEEPDQRHNNCSGKHTGFLTLAAELGGGAEYIEIDHPVQTTVRAAFEEVTGMESPTWGVDGCSAPNFATGLSALARGMAEFAGAHGRSGKRAEAQAALVEAMMSHPDLVAGEGRACTRLMRALGGKGAVKTGADGVFVGILPGLGIGMALKIEDGATRGSEAVMAALLAGAGVIEADHPEIRRLTHGPLPNRRGLPASHLELTAPLASWRL